MLCFVFFFAFCATGEAARGEGFGFASAFAVRQLPEVRGHISSRMLQAVGRQVDAGELVSPPRVPSSPRPEIYGAHRPVVFPPSRSISSHHRYISRLSPERPSRSLALALAMARVFTPALSDFSPPFQRCWVFRAQPDRVSTLPEIFGSVATRVSSPRPVLPASRNLRRP